jgi:serine/threonine protein phosphatase 1
MTKTKKQERWVAVADLHGHPKSLKALLEALEDELGDSYRLALLGDYVDNGPDTPGLLDFLIELQADRGDRFIAIMGNHDLACLRSIGFVNGQVDQAWYQRWSSYWNRGLGTAEAYGAHSGEQLKKLMPAAHFDFLNSRPWYYDTGEYFFVHAGLDIGPIAPQRAELEEKLLPRENHLWSPLALQDKRRACLVDSNWDRVVVSGHTKDPGVKKKSGRANFMRPERICLSAEVDGSGTLFAVILPERRVVRVDPDLTVHFSEP